MFPFVGVLKNSYVDEESDYIRNYRITTFTEDPEEHFVSILNPYVLCP